VNRTQKEEFVESLRQDLEGARSVILTNHTGIDVNTVNELRSEFRAQGVTYRVVKNTLARLAIDGTEFEPIYEALRGPVAFAFSHEDAVSPAKIIKEFAEENENFTVKGGFLDGEMLDVAQVMQLAEMPTKDELRSKLLSVFLGVPTKFVRTLNAAPQKFVMLLKARQQDLD
jgi:large subunit ribosomal protein L10